jgi:hypothetical protein
MFDKVVPSLQYPGNTSLERAYLFITDSVGGAIPYFEDFNIEICEDSDTECLKSCFDISSGMHSTSISLGSSLIYAALSIALTVLSTF